MPLLFCRGSCTGGSSRASGSSTFPDRRGERSLPPHARPPAPIRPSPPCPMRSPEKHGAPFPLQIELRRATEQGALCDPRTLRFVTDEWGPLPPAHPPPAGTDPSYQPGPQPYPEQYGSVPGGPQPQPAPPTRGRKGPLAMLIAGLACGVVSVILILI